MKTMGELHHEAPPLKSSTSPIPLSRAVPRRQPPWSLDTPDMNKIWILVGPITALICQIIMTHPPLLHLQPTR